MASFRPFVHIQNEKYSDLILPTLKTMKFMSSPSSTCAVYILPRLTTFRLAWKYMKALVENAGVSRKAGSPVADSLLLVQHPSVYTLGKGASLENVKFRSSAMKTKSADNSNSSGGDFSRLNDEKHEIIRIERGGEVTWHGPGQMVAYPILDLHNHKKDLHWYTNNLEESTIRCLQNFGLSGTRSKVNTGVWIGQNKIAAIGVTASRWVTMHGTAINVHCDMNYFNNIIPCGITEPGHGVTSLKNELTLLLEQQRQLERAAVSASAAGVDAPPAVEDSPASDTSDSMKTTSEGAGSCAVAVSKTPLAFGGDLEELLKSDDVMFEKTRSLFLKSFMDCFQMDYELRAEDELRAVMAKYPDVVRGCDDPMG